MFYVDQMIGRGEYNKKICNKCEQLIILEIGYDSIATASSFVTYISNVYGFSKSTIWYNLKNLKNKHILNFATRQDPKEYLSLTKSGARYFDIIQKQKLRITNYFNSKYTKKAMLVNHASEYYSTDITATSINIPLA